MSYEDGWAAINLDMPKRVPRTEYSADGHWELIKSVTGIEVSTDSPDDVKEEARRRFVGPEGWNYDFFWSMLIYKQPLEACRTDMGHAEFAAGGTDRRDTIYCPFSNPEEVLAFDPLRTYGVQDRAELTRGFKEHYKNNKLKNPGGVNVTGIYITLMSGLIEIFGWDMLLMAAGIDLAGFGEVANRYTLWIQQFFDALGDADVPVVVVHDDIVWSEGPFIHPDWYRKYIFPNYKRLFAPLIAADKKIMYTCDGNYTQFVDDIADCVIHGFIMEPLTDMKYVAEKYGKTHVFIGNADTRILLSGTKSEIRAEVKRCMDIGKNYPGFFMSVGNQIPANTPVESALYYNEVYEELSER